NEGSRRPLTLNRESAERAAPAKLSSTPLPPLVSSASETANPEVDLDTFHEQLVQIFNGVQKGTPLKAQSASAYQGLNPYQQEFLDWLPLSPDFKGIRHAGGLPTLIEQFFSVRASGRTVPSFGPTAPDPVAGQVSNRDRKVFHALEVLKGTADA